MKRDILALENCLFDVLIVGGGIHGAATARECARSGLKVALVEKNDFGSGTSANSLKIIHGGLRYLQHLNIKRMRESIQSRRIMMALAPNYVRALSCVIPNFGYGFRSNFFMRIALKLYDIISLDRNKGVQGDRKLPCGRILKKKEFSDLFPAVQSRNITGASLWYDVLALNSERLTLSFVHDAVKNGAMVANYAPVTEIIVEKGSVTGGLVYDSLQERTIKIKAKTVVVASGPGNSIGIDGIDMAGSGGKKESKVSLAKAVNIVVKKKLFADYALGLTGDIGFEDRDAVLKKKGRLFFFVPWRGYTMIGTTYTMCAGNSDALKVTQKDVGDFLSEVNSIYPEAQLTKKDVTKVHVGLVPAYPQFPNSDDVQLEKETQISDFNDGNNKIHGLFSVKSVKFTTAPIVAKQILQKLVLFLQFSEKRDKPKKVKITEHVFENCFENIPEEKHFLIERYGAESKTVSKYVAKSKRKISSSPLLLSGEIDYFIHEEMAHTLSDIVFRRTELATAECPDENVLKEIAQYLGKYFNWDEKRKDAEVQFVIESFDFK